MPKPGSCRPDTERAKVIKYPIAQAMRQVRIEVRITGRRVAMARVRAALLLFRLAGWVSGCNVVVALDQPDRRPRWREHLLPIEEQLLLEDLSGPMGRPA